MKLTADGTRVVWKPLPGSQSLAMNTPAAITVYHGTRGPGKTDAQLMYFRRFVGQGYGKHWRGIIFDREYKNLDDLVAKSMRWFPEFKDGARWCSSKADYKWVWPTGEELLFRTLKRPADYWGYHGQEFPFIGWNELTKYPTDELFEAMLSCNRSSFLPEDFPIYIDERLLVQTGEMRVVQPYHKYSKAIYLPEIPLKVFVTTNPYGAGHNWVKKRFIDPSDMGQLFKTTVNVFNPRTQKREDIVKTQVHLFGSYRENKYLSPEYVAVLEGITDKNKREAWLKGSWDIVAGGMFDGNWDKDVHVVTPFEIPPSWKIDRAFDWGSSAPFSVGWWAESDGSDYIDGHGNERSTVRGDIFRIGEWYGSTGKANQGLRMLATEVTCGIIQRELAMGIHRRVYPGPADNSIWDVINGNSIAVDMAKATRIDGKMYSGIQWVRSDKSSGSRKAGWNKLRLFLNQAKPNITVNDKGVAVQLPREKPGMFIFNTCKHFIDLVPILPRDEDDPDDVDTESEDHIGDEARYKVLGLAMGVKGGRTAGV